MHVAHEQLQLEFSLFCVLILHIIIPAVRTAATLLPPPRRRPALLIPHFQRMYVCVHYTLDLHQVIDRLGIG